ncbi:hypothetical protein OIU85_003889 [Salix viminalis]|uniref:XS domain-containing protein n=1 Tax=Salix viminalis TaxID=40686 RepID=A0A9Q0Q0C3_SALVM|nr:hypothetical protein OIU85_003889 [Salix viminalis]
MGSRGGGKPFGSGANTSLSSKGKNVSESSGPAVEQLSQGVADIGLDSAQDDGEWEVIAKKSKNRAGSSAAKPWGSQNTNNKAWGNPEVIQKVGMRNNGGSGKNPGNARSTQPVDPRGPTGRGTARPQTFNRGVQSNYAAPQPSHETRKSSRWFKKFFDSLDSLSIEEINEPARQWHCPACQGGPGAIDWYRGLQPLITHAKTKGSKRLGEVFGKWKGLKDDEKDHEIVWPPMVIVMNTRLEQDDNDKWLGMGNQELLDYFSGYAAVKSRHSYGPQGHRGMSILIFESSARGYLEAERLHKHFAEQGTDRNAWDRRRVLFYQGGKRQLYGYMALKEDLDLFNQHSQGKSRLKYELRSYHEMVVNQIRQMAEDNQQLIYLKNKVVKEQRHSKQLEESFGIVSEKLRKTMEENRIVRQRTQMHHEQNKEELDFQEQFFKEQLQTIREQREAKEEDFEKLQQDKRQQVKELNANPSNNEDYRSRVEKVEDFIELQDKEMEEYVAERDSLIEEHGEKMTTMKRRHLEEELEMEKEFDARLAGLMKKYTPNQAEGSANV